MKDNQFAIKHFPDITYDIGPIAVDGLNVDVFATADVKYTNKGLDIISIDYIDACILSNTSSIPLEQKNLVNSKKLFYCHLRQEIERLVLQIANKIPAHQWEEMAKETFE